MSSTEKVYWVHIVGDQEVLVVTKIPFIVLSTIYFPNISTAEYLPRDRKKSYSSMCVNGKNCVV